MTFNCPAEPGHCDCSKSEEAVGVYRRMLLRVYNSTQLLMYDSQCEFGSHANVACSTLQLPV